LVIARESGWIDEAMKEINVDVVWTDFESGPPMNESFAAGQQDIGVIGDVPAVSAVAAGQDNVYIAAAEGGPSYGMLVADDSGIESVADLKGKKVGLTIGSTAQNLTQKLLADAGMDYNTDIEVINISTGDAQVVLTKGDVDAVVIWEPNVSRLDATDGIHLLTDGGDVGFPGVNVVFARKEFVDANPDIVKAYLEQYWRATKAYEENPEEYAELAKSYFNLDKDLIMKAASKYNYTLTFSDADVEGLQDTVSFLKGIGSISNEITVKDHVADSIAKEVAK
ncbi:MAG: aliphatic sulfonate ABC transporter substrate-binding protein, partial [Lachnospiraceae bacterium]|nr:aliphatic sulfonate ABC transporter substrate-binding protein [Lachnospiraceae bacterium]